MVQERQFPRQMATRFVENFEVEQKSADYRGVFFVGFEEKNPNNIPQWIHYCVSQNIHPLPRFWIPNLYNPLVGVILVRVIC